jgi:hypothetical protein
MSVDPRSPAARLADTPLIPDDLGAIIVAALDLAYYRRNLPVADDLATAVAHELEARVSKLPEVRQLEVGARSVTDVGRGDFVKVGGEWKQITRAEVTKVDRRPREWRIETADGTYGMYEIELYAKAGDPILKDA